MMRHLNKEQIQFIDNYLIQNKVKYWDVRLELLDHIIASVEQKMENGLLFNDALLEAHEGFGNKIGNYTNPSFEDKLYYSNHGFKKFTMSKQKEINRKNRREYWVGFIPFLESKKFILEYCALIALVISIFKYNHKAAFIVSLIAALLPVAAKFYYVLKEKAARKSLNIQMKVSLDFGLMPLNYYMLLGFSWFNKGELSKPYIYLIVVYLIAFPFLRHDINIYKSMLKTYKKRYELMVS